MVDVRVGSTCTSCSYRRLLESLRIKGNTSKWVQIHYKYLVLILIEIFQESRSQMLTENTKKFIICIVVLELVFFLDPFFKKKIAFISLNLSLNDWRKQAVKSKSSMIPAENLRSIENEIYPMISLCGKTITNDANEFFPELN